MLEGAPQYFSRRSQWRVWLKAHHATQTVIWLKFYKKYTTKPSLSYDDAVEEALCFGWIDSTVRRIDDESYVRKFSPRRKGSVWSNLNRGRMQKVIAAGRVTEAGLAVYDPDAPPEIARQHLPTIPVPADLKRALAGNADAKKHFAALTKKYVQMCLRWITTAKKPETRARRIAEFVELTSRSARLGMK